MAATYLETALILASLYGIVTLAVCASYRFLSFPDLSPDATFVLGPVVSAKLILIGQPLLISFCSGVLAGATAGVVTATLNKWARINKLFSGILLVLASYTVCLRILGGANASLLDAHSFFESLSDSGIATISFICLGIAWLALLLFFHTRNGLSARALASNPTALGWSRAKEWTQTIVILAFTNGLAALAGILVSQFQGFVDVGMGLGVTLNAFACLFLGEAMIGLLSARMQAQVSRIRLGRFHFSPRVLGGLIAAVVGSLFLFSVTTGVLYLGLAPSDLRLVSVVLFIIGLTIRRRRPSRLLPHPGSLEQ